MNRRKLLAKLTHGSLTNVAINDMTMLVEAFGFRLERMSGSHHIYAHPDIPQLLNLQQVSGEAKPYQIRQFLRLVERYSLGLKEDD